MKNKQKSCGRDLSHAEQLIWSGQQLAGNRPIYNMALAMSLENVDIERFQEAFLTVASRFPTLKARAQSNSDQAQIYLDVSEPHTLPVVDFSSRIDAKKDAWDWVQKRATTPMQLNKQLYDSALLLLDEYRSVWFFNQHHIVTDAWSCRLLIQAVATQYSQGPEPTSSSDIIDTGAGSLVDVDSARIQQSQQHWLAVYRSAGQEGPLCRGRSAGIEWASSRRQIVLNPAKMDTIRQYAGQLFPSFSQQLSVFTAFAALHAALVSRLSRRARIVFETPAANRTAPGQSDQPGLAIELFPFAVDVGQLTTFVEAGRQISEQIPGFVKYGHRGASVAGRNSACDSVLNFIPFTLGEFEKKPVKTTFVHPGCQDPAHLLRLQLWDLQGDGGLTVMLDMNDSAFPESEKSRIPGYFLTLLEQLLSDAQVPIASVPLLDHYHCGSPLTTFNDTCTQPLPTLPLLHKILSNAAQQPSAIAISCHGHTTSYAELAHQVDTCAQQLAIAGVRQGDRVAVCIERSAAQMPILLGVMRLGACYVPIDPALSAARQRNITVQADVRAVVQSAIDAEDKDQPIHLTTAALMRPVEGDFKLIPAVSDLGLEDPAYILFTSGSTGTPKGVPVSQRGLAVYIEWACRQYADQGPVKMPLLSSLAFDLTVTSMYLPLVTGGTLYIYPKSVGVLDTALLDALQDNQVDTIKLTPGHLRLLLHANIEHANLRTMIVGGEQLHTALAKSVRKKFGSHLRIFNEYGPTETVVGCMIHQYQYQLDNEAAVPIGKPADHTRIYILNTALQPVTPGVTGEIFVQRAGAPDSYLSPGEKSNQQFMPDLVDATATMYRTGDLGRFNEFGQIEFLGREDDQVKISGHRIELGEVEAALEAHPAVKACAVIINQTKQDDEADQLECVVCGAGSKNPGISLNPQGVCQICTEYARLSPRIADYFRQRDQLKQAIAQRAEQRQGRYDCLVLLSGGKDSTYALYQVAMMGFDIHAFTLDNGYVSEQARANIQRVVDDLGISHEFASTEYMNEIFHDSLDHFSNVCQGCFKTIYTLSIRRADELGIPVVVTGLSRGQLFETRLNLSLFRGNRDDNAIDAAVLDARKAYHRRPDAVTRCLGNGEFDSDAIFERVTLIDFYRYWSATLDEMLGFLSQNAPWIRPSDTGRSSNCLINDAGIQVHQYERGFHNYALPYSWDVRLGQKNRQQAIDELHDDIDHQRVAEILDTLDYQPVRRELPQPARLVAFYESDVPIEAEQLLEFLQAQILDWALPTQILRVVDGIPLTINGKTDRAALLDGLRKMKSSSNYRQPSGDSELAVAALWKELLGDVQIGGDDNFFDLGGTSLLAIELVKRLSELYEIQLPLELAFNKPRLDELATALEQALIEDIAQLSNSELTQSLVNEAPRER